MTEKKIDLEKLKEPFAPEDLIYRVSRGGLKDNGKPWAKIFTYVDDRAIQDRLDEVCGIENWRNEYVELIMGNGFLCGISIRIDGEWVTKWNGANNTEFEPIKGGISGAGKRTGSTWGVGRYLYNLPERWADICGNGAFNGSFKFKEKGTGKKKTHYMKYDVPKMSKEFLPSGYKYPDGKPPEKKKEEKADPTENGLKGTGLSPEYVAKKKLIETVPGLPQLEEVGNEISALGKKLTIPEKKGLKAAYKKKWKELKNA